MCYMHQYRSIDRSMSVSIDTSSHCRKDEVYRGDRCEPGRDSTQNLSQRETVSDRQTENDSKEKKSSRRGAEKRSSARARASSVSESGASRRTSSDRG